MALFKVPVAELRLHVDPLDGQMWKCRPISEADVRLAVGGGVVELRPWDQVINTLDEESSRRYHVARIATLVGQPDSERIIVCVENHVTPVRVYLNDGNHRLAAAYVRGDKEIIALLACSVPGREKDVFPGATPV